MTIAINVRMQWRRRNKDNLRRLHWVMFREIDLKLIGLVSIQCAGCANDINDPPLKIIGDSVLEARRRVDLPFNQFLLQAVACDFAQCLARGSRRAGHAS